MGENGKPNEIIDVTPSETGGAADEIKFDVGAGAGAGTAAGANGGSAGAASGDQLPMLYKKPTLLRAEEHGDLVFSSVTNFAFAREVNSVPLNGVEFALAQRSYPIVFSDDDTCFPVALIGLRQNKNLFVDASGQWAKGAYIPAYIRRYPFIFYSDDKQENFALCVDMASEFVAPGSGGPIRDDQAMFFKDKEPTELTQNALRFCSEFQGHYQNTVALCEALREQNLLISNRAEIRLRSGGTLSVGNFRVIDENRLQVLSKDVITSWWEKGWLPLIYAHLMSLATWAALGDRLAEEEE